MPSECKNTRVERLEKVVERGLNNTDRYVITFYKKNYPQPNRLDYNRDVVTRVIFPCYKANEDQERFPTLDRTRQKPVTCGVFNTYFPRRSRLTRR